MFEKVNPSHPDKIADRIAGAIVDLAYKKAKNPKVAVEVLIGHGECNIINETSENFSDIEIERIVDRIAGPDIWTRYKEVGQDEHLANNQDDKIRCGDNGIFKGMPTTTEQYQLTYTAQRIYKKFPYDGKYIQSDDRLIICQSNAWNELNKMYPHAEVNPLGPWTGGSNVDTGATNRKLGSDMGDAVTGGGLHGKDLSKADVTLNIYAHIMAKKKGKPYSCSCAIGDEYVDGLPYSALVEIARDYIENIGGFEKFAEWGIIR